MRLKWMAPGSRVRASQKSLTAHSLREFREAQHGQMVLTRSSLRWRFLALSVILVAAVPGVLVLAAPGASATPPANSVVWKGCPHYSPAVIRYVMRSTAPVKTVDRLLSRLQCGTLRVPLNYGRPNSQLITIAITRLPATDAKHSLGDLVVNPGGPGTSGYLMPIQLVTSNNQVAKLDDHYNLIGFDPRGVGYSARVSCPSLSQTRANADWRAHRAGGVCAVQAQRRRKRRVRPCPSRVP
jgi:hypothetical protein